MSQHHEKYVTGTACLLIATHGCATNCQIQKRKCCNNNNNNKRSRVTGGTGSNTKNINVKIISEVAYSKTSYNSENYVNMVIPNIHKFITKYEEENVNKNDELCKFSGALSKMMLCDPTTRQQIKNAKLGTCFTELKTDNPEFNNRVFLTRDYNDIKGYYNKLFGINCDNEKNYCDDFKIKLHYKHRDVYYHREIAGVDVPEKYDISLSNIINTICVTYPNLDDLIIIDLSCSTCENIIDENDKRTCRKTVRVDVKEHLINCPKFENTVASIINTEPELFKPYFVEKQCVEQQCIEQQCVEQLTITQYGGDSSYPKLHKMIKQTQKELHDESLRIKQTALDKINHTIFEMINHVVNNKTNKQLSFNKIHNKISKHLATKKDLSSVNSKFNKLVIAKKDTIDIKQLDKSTRHAHKAIVLHLKKKDIKIDDKSTVFIAIMVEHLLIRICKMSGDRLKKMTKNTSKTITIEDVDFVKDKLFIKPKIN